jgi:hypothetical protein
MEPILSIEEVAKKLSGPPHFMNVALHPDPSDEEAVAAWNRKAHAAWGEHDAEEDDDESVIDMSAVEDEVHAYGIDGLVSPGFAMFYPIAGMPLIEVS